MKSRSSFLTISLSILFLAIGMGPRIGSAVEPIKIGFMAPYVGASASFGRDLRDGFKMCLDEYGYKVAGRPIVFVDEETEGKPEVGLVKARKLVEKDQIHILSG